MPTFPSVRVIMLSAALAALPWLNPALAQDAPASAPLAVPKQTGSPQLVVASVKLDGGWRASKMIGAAVYDDQNQRIGSVDDLIITGQNTLTVAVVSVGGFLGLGSKLVAVPYNNLRYDPTARDAKVVMPGANKDSLGAMPNFVYVGG